MIPVTLETFYHGLIYLHSRQPEKSVTTPQMIAATEERLGVCLPTLLRTLYERQNGGHLGNLWVAKCPSPSAYIDDWRGAFAPDYCYLIPLELMRTVYDSYLDVFTEDELDDISPQAKQQIILCQRYNDTTLLDYSNLGEPRVGIVDVELPADHPENIWFDNFEQFFAALRRGEPEYKER